MLHDTGMCDMNEIIQWFEDRYDPDELVDLLEISTAELVRKFYDRAKDYKLDEQGGGEEEEAFEEGL